MDWIEAASERELEEKGRLLFRQGRRQVALFHVAGKPYAVDNRCPHQGYPLKQGTVDEEQCVLTCQWHNWKFDLTSGRNLQGRDAVRSYPVKCEDGRIWLDLREPPAEERKAEILAGLRESVERHQYGRIARGMARLVSTGLDPLDAIRETVIFSHDRLEYGTTHAYAAAPDWLTLYEESAGDEVRQVSCLSEVTDHIAADVLRQPVFPYNDRELPFDGAGFLRAVEDEDEASAVAMALSGLRDGMGWEDLEPWLAEAALQHYLSFGHALIFVHKTGELIGKLGAKFTNYLVPPLVRMIVYGTREDLLPEFRSYATIAADAPAELGTEQDPLETDDLLQASIKGALEWVRDRAASASPESLLDALLGANAHHLLSYDESFQHAHHLPVSQNVGWLSFTHGLTFPNAARVLCRKYPRLWYPALLQSACFAGRNKPFTKVDEEQAARFEVDDAETFFAGALERVTDHGLDVPIFSSHLLKTTIAVREEVPLASPRTRRWLLASLDRFLRASLKQRHVRRAASQALALVGRG